RGRDVWESSSLYLWVDLQSGARVRMDSVRWAHGARTPEVVVSIPFAAAPSATVGGDRALITDGRTPEIGEYDIEGRLRRLLRVSIAARPITPEMLSAWFESMAEHMTRYSAAGWRVAYDEAGVPVPDDLPVFTDLMVDELGWVWARLEVGDPSAPSEWMVFDTDGRARGTVRTPSGLAVQEIGDTAIIGVWQNELGVEHVRLHLLRRTLR
ncbi:MAG TPA: hypothetical protein VMN39_08040, partial [Longimicrobiaceae bacterium]|nr:hypothetical protein [Longimicrobiaceae bacterium]